MSYKWMVAGIALVIATPVVLSGFWFSKGFWGISDWDYYFSLHTYWRQQIVQYHQFPLWNPWTCGGTAALADPEFSVLTPTFLLELIFGVPTGLRLAIYFSVITGGLGMLALSKKLKLSVVAGLLAAVGYMFGSVNLLEIVEGHVNVFAAMWIPWIFWSWLTAYREGVARRGFGGADGTGPLRTLPTTLCAVFLAITFYQGGVYLLMYTALALLVLPLFTAHPRRAYLVTFWAGLTSLGLSAFKLVPVIFWLREFPDTAYASSMFTIPYLHLILFGRYLHGANVFQGQNGGWHEYGAYIGITLFALSLVSLFLFKKNRIIRVLWIAAATAVVVSSAGPFLKPLFDIAPFIPRSNISRFILFAIIPLCLLAGFGVQWVQKRLKMPWISAFLLVLAAAELTSFSYQLSKQAFVIPPVLNLPSAAPSPLAFTTNTYPFRLQRKGDKPGEGIDYDRSYAAALTGWGTLNYCSSLGPIPQVRTITDEGHDSISVGNTASLATVEWTPNHVIATGTTREKTHIFLNTNYARSWQANGGVANEASGRVATEVGPGSFSVTFSYEPYGLRQGAAISLVTIIGVIGRMVYSYFISKRATYE